MELFVQHSDSFWLFLWEWSRAPVFLPAFWLWGANGTKGRTEVPIDVHPEVPLVLTSPILVHVLPVFLHDIFGRFILSHTIVPIVSVDVDKGEQDQQTVIEHILEVKVVEEIVQYIIQYFLHQFDWVGLSWVHVACNQSGWVCGQFRNLALLFLYSFNITQGLPVMT